MAKSSESTPEFAMGVRYVYPTQAERDAVAAKIRAKLPELRRELGRALRRADQRARIPTRRHPQL